MNSKPRTNQLLASRRRFALHTAKVAVAVMLIVAAIPPVQATAQEMPSGQYLELTDRHVWLYDNRTGTMLDQGPTLESSSCTTLVEGGYPVRQQCGDCRYVPNGNNPTTGNPWWFSSTTAYSYGRCASVDVRNDDDLRTRIDAMVAHPAPLPQDVFQGEIRVRFMKLGEPNPVKEQAVKAFPSGGNVSSMCQNTASLSRCGSLMYSPVLDLLVPSEPWDYYCFGVTIFKTPGPNPTVSISAEACTD